MIKISKKSWHFRMACIGSRLGYPSDGLCKYIRELIAGLLFFCVAAFLIGVLLIYNIMAVVALFQGIWVINEFFGVVSAVTVVVAVVIGGAISLNTLSQYVKAHSRNDKDKEPSIIGLYVKTVKDKICPVIDEFVD